MRIDKYFFSYVERPLVLGPNVLLMNALAASILLSPPLHLHQFPTEIALRNPARQVLVQHSMLVLGAGRLVDDQRSIETLYASLIGQSKAYI
jgi:hypothetical protein